MTGTHHVTTINNCLNILKKIDFDFPQYNIRNSNNMTTMTTMTNDEFDAATALVSLRKPKQGHLAKVSLYEFVNDWVRPEISFKIFSYLGDPHKEGIKKAQKYRRVFVKGTNHKRYYSLTHQAHNNDNHHHPGRPPYNNTPLYRIIDRGYDEKVQACGWGATNLGRWTTKNKWQRPSKMTTHELKYCNYIVRELWAFTRRRRSPSPIPPHWSHWGRYTLTNGDFNDHLKNNNVKGRSKMCKGKPLNQSNTRRSAITALIKL